MLYVHKEIFLNIIAWIILAINLLVFFFFFFFPFLVTFQFLFLQKRYLDYQPQTSSIFLGSNGNSNIVMDDRIIRLKKIFSVHNTLCISGEKVKVILNLYHKMVGSLSVVNHKRVLWKWIL